ncbi:protein kinase family protein [Alkalihalobacillus sp. FSL W8-0930]
MRNSYSTKSPIKFASGARFLGKWNKKQYTVIRTLGEGATGTVYLTQSTDGLVALKMGTDGMAITNEVNVLRQFSKKTRVVLGPKLMDVDDMLFDGTTYPFYAMEYVKGEALITFMHGKGPEWLGLMILQLLGDLENLHKEGWVFGDLKPDNLLVTGPPSRVRWLDVGGTTLLGRSIKEYTEFFDRGYWTLGTRKAEPSYDLFSVAMIMINCAYPKRFDKKSGSPLQQLKSSIHGQPLLRPYESILVKALTGHYNQAGSMKRDLTQVMQQVTASERTVTTKRLRAKKHKKKRGFKVELALSATLLFVGCLLYLFILTM